ncbi:MAG: flagellar biosynthetic protein FliO [Candidatus Methylomirabilota bacterium]|nr:MAG: flagellar biosynthetic protein FliO [candidate division NC10 bacterium]
MVRKAALWLTIPLWLLTALPCAASAEPLPATSASETAPIAESQRLDLPSYRDPESSLPGVGVTSQIFTALGTVLGILALGIYLYKRIAMRGSRGARRDGTIQVLSRTYLGPKESLCLVRVGGDVLLLGQTGNGISLLHTLPSGVAAASSDADDATIDPTGRTDNRVPSEFARERGAALAGLESRLKRLNRLWGTEGSE